MMPAVVVDVGNTRVKWGRCAPDRVMDMASLPHNDENDWQRQLDAWQNSPQSNWVLSGVCPSQRQLLGDWLVRQGHQVVIVDSYRQLPLQIAVDSPDRVGIDRLLDAVAANAVRSADHAAIIVDAGTAVTVNYVDAAGTFQGGAILPGFRLMAKALQDHTALLPMIADFSLAAGPAKNTEDAIRTGILQAILGGVESLVNRWRTLEHAALELFLTGGDAPRLAPHLNYPARVWPEMTLEGLRRSVG